MSREEPHVHGEGGMIIMVLPVYPFLFDCHRAYLSVSLHILTFSGHHGKPP